MQDRFEGSSTGFDSPATHAFAVTPGDGSDLPEVTRALYVGAPGNISVVTLSNATVTLNGVGAGTILPLRVRRVRATGTTASAIVGLV